MHVPGGIELGSFRCGLTVAAACMLAAVALGCGGEPPCAQADCAGVCGGPARLDCAGSCGGDARTDCAGVCGGDAVTDCHGVCGGTAERDCALVCGGTAVVDCNGACGGPARVDCLGICEGTAETDCLGVCAGSAVVDCAGVCGGRARLDCAGVCGGAAERDCAGVCGGAAVVDCNDLCGGPARFDCLGICEGTAEIDCLGVCGGDAARDCAGVCNGDNATDCAGVCGGDSQTDCLGVCDGGATTDCLGVCGGPAVVDCLGVCGGGLVTDCHGICGGGGALDCAGVCDGSAATDCLGICEGTAETDCLGTCGGDATTDCLGVCGGTALVDCNGVCGGPDGPADCLGRCGGLCPLGYYDSADDASAAALRASLHALIDDHTVYSYSAAWDVLREADEDPLDDTRILDAYRNASIAKTSTSSYNREHVWPDSYGSPDLAGTPAYSDCHHLHLTDVSYNSARGNHPFGTCDASCSEYPTYSYDGRGGGSGVYPGHSNWQDNGERIWEVWDGRRGDIARSMFYMDVRYEGGGGEPDLVLTDTLGLIQVGSPYCGRLSVLLAWHAQDPVDEDELRRNDVVFTYQGNRNPFVDHPEWVACVFQGLCP